MSDLINHLNWKIEALKHIQGQPIIDSLTAARDRIEKLEQDKKILRWALEQARQALLHDERYINGSVLSILDTAQSMTEPANDR